MGPVAAIVPSTAAFTQLSMESCHCVLLRLYEGRTKVHLRWATTDWERAAMAAA